MKSRFNWWTPLHWNIFAWFIWGQLSRKTMGFKKWLKEYPEVSDMRGIARMKIKEYERKENAPQ